MIFAEGVRYTNRVLLSGFRKCMGRVPSDEKIPDDTSAEDKCTVPGMNRMKHQLTTKQVHDHDATCTVLYLVRYPPKDPESDDGPMAPNSAGFLHTPWRRQGAPTVERSTSNDTDSVEHELP